MKVKGALQLTVLIGIVSLFGDMTYEATRSINGPYLAILGATVGIITIKMRHPLIPTLQRGNEEPAEMS